MDEYDRQQEAFYAEEHRKASAAAWEKSKKLKEIMNKAAAALDPEELKFVWRVLMTGDINKA